jgi:hypothetical protein
VTSKYLRLAAHQTHASPRKHGNKKVRLIYLFEEKMLQSLSYVIYLPFVELVSFVNTKALTFV